MSASAAGGKCGDAAQLAGTDVHFLRADKSGAAATLLRDIHTMLVRLVTAPVNSRGK